MHHKNKLRMAWGIGITHWQTTWINENGNLKVKSTYTLPKVQNNFNRSVGDPIIPMNFYKDVAIGDKDYYGWFCIEIVEVMCLTDNPPIGIEYLNERYSPLIYRRLNRNHKQKHYRDRMRKPQW